MPAELTKGEVEGLEALLEKATQGPLEVRENHPHGRQIWSLHEDHGAEPVASYLYDVDAQLFAKAINALPALLTLARSAPSEEEMGSVGTSPSPTDGTGGGAEQRPAGASTQCPHSDLHFHLNNAGFGDTNLHYLEVTARCKICDQPVRFRGPVGLSPNQAMVSLCGDEVRIPFLVGDEELTGKPSSYVVRGPHVA